MSLRSWRTAATFLATPAVIVIVVAAIALANDAATHRAVAAKWTSAGEIRVARAYSTATVLPDGSVLVVGGLDDPRDGAPSVSVDGPTEATKSELYEPLAGTSEALPQVLLGRIHHTATLTGDLVVVTGGVEFHSNDWHAIDRTDVYDTKTRTWRTVGALATARTDASAVAMKDGRVLVAGGHDGPRMFASAEIFDPQTGRWSAAAPMPTARTQFTMATLPDGRVLAAGGLEFPGAPSATSLFYDPGANAWTKGPDMLVERVLHADAQLADGSVLLIGGQNAAGSSVEIFDVRTQQFAIFGTLNEPRMLAQAVALPDGSVIVTGGLSPLRNVTDFSPRPTAERYDPTRHRFEPFASPTDARAFAKLAVVGSGVYQIGGVASGERPTKLIEALGWR